MKKYTNEDFIKKAKEKFGNKFDFTKTNYINSQTEVCITCPEHGDIWVLPYVFLQSVNGCPECSGLKKWNTEKFKEKARNVHGNKYDYSKTVYVNKRTDVIITCPIHGDFTQNPHNHIFQKNGCPECGKKYAKEWRKGNSDYFIDESKKRFGDIYEFPNIDEEYENSHSKITIKCKKCGNVFTKIACDHLTSPHGGCLKCYTNKSSAEEEIGTFLKTLLGDDKVFFRQRNIIRGFELDMYIPDKKIAVEYNGIYWHNEDKKGKNYHLAKTEACENLGIQLVQIFEDEYVNNKEIVLNKLRHIVGKSSCLKIMARKCEVREINNAEAKKFLTKNHIQGFSPSTLYLGLFYGDEIVSCMTFIKRMEEWELNRFATKNDIICQGAGGKLFSYFIKKVNPLIVKSFADRRWTSNFKNNLYDKLGFKKVGFIAPDYRYVITKRNEIKRAHKFAFRKKRLSKIYNLPMSMTETEMAKEIGLHRIYDCGLIKYVWKRQE